MLDSSRPFPKVYSNNQHATSSQAVQCRSYVIANIETEHNNKIEYVFNVYINITFKIYIFEIYSIVTANNYIHPVY